MNDRDKEEQRAFLEAIQAEPYNETNRKVYADWLDERDLPEEADFFRCWTLEKHRKAEEWLINFANKMNQIDQEESLEPIYMTLEKLLEIGKVHLKYYHNTPVEWGVLRFTDRNTEEFWDNFSIVAGVRLDEDFDKKERSPFVCPC